jgi:hypothetical protein
VERHVSLPTWNRHSYNVPTCLEPNEGMALAFMHSIWHEGAVVRSVKKYVLRTDVMFKQVSKV